MVKISFKVMTRLVAGWLVLTGVGEAKSLFVTDILHIAVRSGPGANDSVVSNIKSGDSLELLDEQSSPGFSKVKTSDGKEGWIKNTYLSDKPIARDEMEALKKRLSAIENSSGSTKGIVETLKSEAATYKTSSTTLDKENRSLKDELARIKSVSGRALELDEKVKGLEATRKNLEEKLAQLSDANAKLSHDSRNEGIKLGISAIVFGLFVGVMLSYVKPPKRREGTLRMR